MAFEKVGAFLVILVMHPHVTAKRTCIDKDELIHLLILAKASADRIYRIIVKYTA